MFPSRDKATATGIDMPNTPIAKGIEPRSSIIGVAAIPTTSK